MRSALLTRPAPAPAAGKRRETAFLFSVTVPGAHFLALQRLIAATQGDAVTRRHEYLQRPGRVRVWLTGGRRTIDGLMSAVMRELPCGEFGRLLPARPLSLS